MSLYTSNELIEKIKTLDTTIESGITGSRIGTGQTDHQINMSVAQMKNQRDYYLRLLQQLHPSVYNAYFGNSVINFGGHHC